MNVDNGQNSLDPYGNHNHHPQYAELFHRQPCPGPWNQTMNSRYGQFQGCRFPTQQIPQWGGGGPWGTGSHHQRPQFNQHFQNYQPRHNFHPDQHSNFKNKQFQQNKRKGPKQKVDKRELPENNRFFCDTCDRGFGSEEKFTEHVDSHEKCSDPSCSYVAAPKLVKLHFQMQHRTGLARKIWQLESPDDVKKWIEERKRNFPTAANIERKKAVQSEKRARGEKLETKYFGKMRGGHNPNNRHPGRHGNRKRHFDSCQSQSDDNPHGAKKTYSETRDDSQSNASSRTVLRGEDPLSAILQQPHSDSKSKNDLPVPPGVKVAGGLASIMASYAADTDTEESPETSPVKHDKPSVTHPSKVTNRETHSAAHITPGTANKQGRNQKKKKSNSETFFNSKKSTLLERLLANEIRHERNVLLQCVHYIVKKKFFDVQMDGKKSSVGS